MAHHKAPRPTVATLWTPWYPAATCGARRPSRSSLASTVFDHLQIADRRERWLVGCADAVVAPLAAIEQWRRAAAPEDAPRRVLLLRLERIGDLLMILDAIYAVRARAPAAEISLAVGSWNADLARLVPAVDRVETIDAPWLSQEGTRSSPRDLASRIARWRRDDLDLAINFEPDIRSNALLVASGARRRVGYATGGGGGFLTTALRYDRTAHTAVNALRLVERALPADASAAAGGAAATLPTARPADPTREVPEAAGSALGRSDGAGPTGEAPGTGRAALRIPEDAQARADRLLAAYDRRGPLVGINPGAGRAIKEWPAGRFAAAALELAERDGATIVLLGSAADRKTAGAVRDALPGHVPRIDLAGDAPLVDLAAVLGRLSVLITADTGPMHLAAALETPVVGIFGPSDPVRYAPLSPRSAVVHADLWCRPCNRMRRPPQRCASGTPDCLTRVGVDAVVEAARRLMRDR